MLKLDDINIERSTTHFERSEMVQEIISSKPGLIVRYGIIFFFIIIIFLIAASWFIQYPDIVSTQAKLTSLNAPKAIVVKSEGQLVKLFAKEADKVQKDQLIGYMESTGNPETILHLSKVLNSLQTSISIGRSESINNYYYSSVLIKSQKELGELQQQYQTFNQSFILFRSYLSRGFYLRKKTMLMKDMETLKRLNENLNQQKNLQLQDVNLAQQTFSANEQLKNDSVISAFDYRNESSKLIGKQISVPQITSSIISNEGAQNEKQKEIMELENQIAQQKNIFIQALNTFISQIEEWKKKYLLISPVDGRIAFSGFLEEHQQLHINQIICFVNPGNSQYYAELYIPQFNLGKVRTGQQVLLKFPSYPYQEYGSLTGKIEFISTIPTDSGFLAKVTLINGLNTNYNEQIQYREGLLAQGEIITRNMRLLQRFYYNIIKQAKK